MLSKIVNPQAAAIVWNYEDRINASGATDPHKIEQIIINTGSLISMSTQKSKGNAAGSFELRLAPTYNWVARLTPGSWVVVLMSQNKPLQEMSPTNPGKADPELVKMLGRIDSVRAVVDVDQSTGARRTHYIVTGQDWASVFDTTLYIDPIVRNSVLQDGSIAHAARIIFNNYLLDWTKNNVALPTPTQVIDAIIKVWGAPLSAMDLDAQFASSPITLTTLPTFSSTAQFQLPKEVVGYFGGFGKNIAITTAVNFADIIKIYAGTLKSYDSYSGDNQEAYGIPDPAKFYGTNSFWQLLVENSNNVLNELVADMRWEGNKANLALYNRARPFINRNSFDGHDLDQVKLNTSYFKNVRKIEIPLEDVISINAGTNWRDKVNFVEIRLGPNLAEENYEAQIKLDSQTTDRRAYERDGFKPMIPVANYLPYKANQPGILAAKEALQWKNLLREWHFNTHLMLNGAVSFIGQNKYIQVGDNIMIDMSVLGASSVNAFQVNSAGAYLLAHVESVSHQFSVEPNGGSRSFITTIQFVRGIVADKNGKMLGLSGAAGFGSDPIDAALDRNASDLAQSSEKNTNVVGSSTSMDPDKQKLKGS